MQFAVQQKSINLNVMKKLFLNGMGYGRAVLFLTIGLLWISNNSNAQDVKLTRQEQKEARRAVLLANFNLLDTLIENKSFVLEAYYLQNRFGDRIIVPQMLNFIKVDSTNVILQTGSYSMFGYNGVGGVTAEGKADSWKLIRNFKSLSYNLRFNVFTDIGIYDVTIWISADKKARATITGLGPGYLTFDGYIEPLDNSGVFKGQRTY
jgi:hypothetical protein